MECWGKLEFWSNGCLVMIWALLGSRASTRATPLLREHESNVGVRAIRGTFWVRFVKSTFDSGRVGF